MNQEILVNVTPRETRIAIVENGTLQEIHIERSNHQSIVGNIYKGRVQKVLPGMEAAFIDAGLSRTAFLHVSDIVHPPEVESPPINHLLHEGQDVVVQVIKEPLGAKGARVTTVVTVPSRYLVLMPDNSQIGVSRRIEALPERERLQNALQHMKDEHPEIPYGYIVRTVAEGVSEEKLKADFEFLNKLWKVVESRMTTAKFGELIYSDLALAFRILRDHFGPQFTRMRIDSGMSFAQITNFVKKYIPGIENRIEYYADERPLFDLYGIEEEIQKALSPKVRLKSGGYLIIDQTEAMTTIDVNTGGFVGHHNLEETLFKTNLEATRAIARQLRLRNLGGIIIIDFIDMDHDEHKQLVFTELERELSKDSSKCHISQVSPLGLIEMTRKRNRESLGHILCEPCSTCQGRGTIKTNITVCFEIFREILREARSFKPNSILVLAAPTVVDRLLDEEAQSIAELESYLGISIRFQAEILYTQEQYDIVPT